MRRPMLTTLAAAAAAALVLGAAPAAAAQGPDPAAPRRAGRLALHCRPDAGPPPVVRCRWSPAGRDGAVRYELFRKALGRGERPAVVFASAALSHDDADVATGGGYAYKVRALTAGGRTVAHSRTVVVRCCRGPGAPRGERPDGDRPGPARPDEATAPRPGDRPGAEAGRLALHCRPAGTDGAPAVGCTWDGLPAERVEGYRLYRKAPGGTPAVIATVPGAGPTRHLDRDVERGATYAYAVEARLNGGRTVRSAVVEVACCP